MQTLVVSNHAAFECTPKGICSVVAASIEPRGFLTSVQTFNPASVVLLGITQPDPLELLCLFRGPGAVEHIPVAIVSSYEELPGFSSCGRSPCLKLRGRFAALVDSQPYKDFGAGTEIIVDLRGREIRYDGKRQSLAPLELRLFILLLRYPMVVFSRRELLRRIAGSDYCAKAQMIDVLIRRIRQKLQPRRGEAEYLHAVRGLGYFFSPGGDTFLDDITGRRFATWPVGVKLT